MAKVSIYIKPEDAWAYFHKNLLRLRNEEDEVARISSDDKSIILSVMLTEQMDQIRITLEDGTNVIRSRLIAGSEVVKEYCKKTIIDAIDQAREIVDDYEAEQGPCDTADATGNHAKADSGCNKTDEEIVEERESELESIVVSFLAKACDITEDEVLDGLESTDMLLKEIVDALEDVLAHDFGYDLYRPRIVKIGGANVVVNTIFEEDDLVAEGLLEDAENDSEVSG